ALVQQEVQVSPSRELVAAALRASEAEFETMQAMAGRLAVDILSRRRIAEGDVEAVRAELRAEAAARQVPPHLQEAVAEAVSLAVGVLSRSRFAEGDVEAVRAGLRAAAAARQVPPQLQEAVAEAVSLAVVPNLLLSPERVERARQEAVRQVQDVIIRGGQVIV